MRAAVLLTLLFLPSFSLASCSPKGETFVYVNGVLTTEEQANVDLRKLQTEYIKKTGNFGTRFITGYNPSHLGGLGDFLKSMRQAYKSADDGFVDDYDLRTILLQIHPEVKTQKILLVGHSQGTFYTNALYSYLVSHGANADSIAVYNVATPASFVSGGGSYLTSANDLVIRQVRDAAVLHGALEPLQSNVLVKPTPADPDGHAFGAVYLGSAAGRIVGDINRALVSRRTAGEDIENCFAPPDQTLGYKAKKVAFAVIDPPALAVRPAALAIGRVVSPVVQLASAAVGAAADSFGRGLAYAQSFFPQPNKYTAAAAFPMVKALYGSGMESADVLDLVTEGQIPIPQARPLPPPRPSEPTRTAQVNDTVGDVVAPAPVPPAPVPQKPEPPPSPPPSVLVSPGYGGGMPAAPAQSAEASPVVESQAVVPAPILTILAILTPAEDALLATTSVTVSGTSTAGALVAVSAGSGAVYTSADSEGNWSAALELTEGSNNISSSVYSESAAATTSVTRQVTVDLTAPAAPTLTVEECGTSLTLSSCLIPQTNASLMWADSADAAWYAIAIDGAWVSTTTATSAVAIFSDGTSARFEVAAFDRAGNAATSTAVEVAAYTQPVVINEIAWAGTDASADDQWFELKNRSPYDIDLSGMALYAEDGSLYVQLSGFIGADGSPGDGNFAIFYRDRTPLPGATHQAAATFTLPSSPLQLILAARAGSATTTLDRTPAAAACPSWCEGAMQIMTGTALVPGGSGAVLPHSLTMERKDASASGVDAANWGTNDMYATRGQDRSGGTIMGTVARENSTHLPEVGLMCDGDSGSVSEGDTYNLRTANCAILSRFIAASASRTASIYRGSEGAVLGLIAGVGAPTLYSTQRIEMDGLEEMSGGDEFFLAIWENRPYRNDNADFDSYLRGALATPPHDNYKVIHLIFARPGPLPMLN